MVCHDYVNTFSSIQKADPLVLHVNNCLLYTKEQDQPELSEQ